MTLSHGAPVLAHGPMILRIFFYCASKPQTGKYNLQHTLSLYFTFSCNLDAPEARDFKLMWSFFDRKKKCLVENGHINRLRLLAVMNDQRAGVRLTDVKLLILLCNGRKYFGFDSFFSSANPDKHGEDK